MKKAQNGDKVRVHYKGTFDGGEVFDSSEGREPLEFVIGSGMVIAGFDKGVTGLSINEKVSIRLMPEEAYGKIREEFIFDLDRKQFPENIDIERGMRFQSSDAEGNAIMFTVTDVSGDTVTVDGNHPMAGKTLNFEIELVEIL